MHPRLRTLCSIFVLSLAPMACVASSADAPAADDGSDLADPHPTDDNLADDFDDGLASSLADEEVIPPLDGLDIDDGAPSDATLGDGRTTESVSTGPHCSSTAHSGLYCGNDKIIGGSATRLYRCSGPGTAAKLVQICGYGCNVEPAGTDDACKPKPPPTCTSTASTGAYCGGDKVAYGSPNTLYHCSGPGTATKLSVCSAGCIVEPAGTADRCKAAPAPDPVAACPHVSAILKWGLHPIASDRLRCAGISSARIMQTIGNAAASAGTHAQDGVYDGHPYTAATDISVKGLTESQVRALVARLDRLGFAAFYRNPGHDGWPSYEIRHMHIVFAGARMKSMLRAQIYDFLANRNGLASHTFYSFYQAPADVKAYVKKIFDAAN